MKRDCEWPIFNKTEEALDIKSLTTLIMATPKTDIEQSVGRILREKHSQPVVVDIIDSHDTFKKQWQKRKVFYKKENYKIIHTKSSIYNPDTSKWSVIYESSKKINKTDDSDNSDEDKNETAVSNKCLLKFKK